VYEEGIQIPPLKLYRAGELNTDLAEIIHTNVRHPAMVWGDIQAQVSSNHVGAQRLLAFMDEYEIDDLQPLAQEVQRRAEEAMRKAISAVPDGTYHGASEVRIAGQNLTLACAVTVDGDELAVEWDAPPELPFGGVNCTLTYTAAHTTYALKSILTPEIPSNAGDFRPLSVRAPEGSVLNCRYPASVNQRTMVGWFCGPAVFRALAAALPNQVQAFTGLPGVCTAYGHDTGGQTYNDHLMLGGGQGGGASGDGQAALMYPTSAGNVPVEMFEQRTPILVDRKEFIPDSGGPGYHRGGLGQRIVVRRLYDNGLPVLVTVAPHGTGAPVAGLLGGYAGGQAGSSIAADAREGIVQLVELLDPREVIKVEAAGGSGYGDPLARPVELIAQDLVEGYITKKGLAAYGAVIVDGAVVRQPRKSSTRSKRRTSTRRKPR
ncbi:MAG TPA: hydantoinase B/oxoprolinase family protein, partial [bacterium]|nr:hydantoinase B/oxoprolinase family protein [bacterium]